MQLCVYSIKIILNESFCKKHYVNIEPSNRQAVLRDAREAGWLDLPTAQWLQLLIRLTPQVFPKVWEQI